MILRDGVLSRGIIHCALLGTELPLAGNATL
jgi:hypothetical protein